MSTSSDMNLLYAIFGVGALLVVGLGGLAISGRTPWPNRTEQLPVSVRDNPSSWRPAYGGYTPYSPSSGGSSGSSGGYSGGK